MFTSSTVSEESEPVCGLSNDFSAFHAGSEKQELALERSLDPQEGGWMMTQPSDSYLYCSFQRRFIV